MEIASPDIPALHCFGLDLRLADNPALTRAVAGGRPVLPVFIWAPEEEAPWPPGAASRWWLHQSLEALQGSLAAHGSRLIIRKGPTVNAILRLAKESGARAVFWNRRYEPAMIARDRELEERLRQRGLTLEICSGNVLFEPGTLLNSSGKPFQVFSAFWRACQAAPQPEKPRQAPRRLPAPLKWPKSLPLSALQLEPKIDWAGGLRETWQPGDAQASQRLSTFLKGVVEDYGVERNRPDHHGTSRLSPHLHFGEISAREVWHRVRRKVPGAAAEVYLRQIAWREFSYHLLYHFPHTAQEPLRAEFSRFPWRARARALRAWTSGHTGYPMVDAAMRELWHTGWMHNRMRMLAASFLVKHLLIPWQEGTRWFWDTLVDADLANNTMGWQWSAGCGADAAPYFRIFNPSIQSRKFDPAGVYVRQWVPEIGSAHYPKPIVEHQAARARALAALASLRQT